MLYIDFSKYKISDYKTLTAGSAGGLTLQVQELLKRGWQPYGSISTNEFYRFQVMVKIEPKFSERD